MRAVCLLYLLINDVLDLSQIKYRSLDVLTPDFWAWGNHIKDFLKPGWRPQLFFFKCSLFSSSPSIDYHRCQKALDAKGVDTAPCDWYKRVYKSLCPISWVKISNILNVFFNGRNHCPKDTRYSSIVIIVRTYTAVLSPMWAEFV